MKILIVGSKGFIGAHCLRFFSDEHETWGCDVFTDYNEKNYFLLDTFSSSYHTIFEEKFFDVCINCAGAASVPDSLTNPERDYELNTHLVFKLLNSIRQYSPDCKFLTISSAAVYGNPEKLPVDEGQNLNPISPYGFHKMYAEKIVKEFAVFFNIKSCCVRIFSAYGSGLRKQLFWDLYQRSQGVKEVQLVGTGEETRDYIFISDIVNAFQCILDEAPFKGECYNVGSGVQHSVKYVSGSFFKSMGLDVHTIFSGNKRTGDPDYWQADIAKLSRLGFEPHVSIDEGLNIYTAWLKSLL